jgi:rubredoxin
MKNHIGDAAVISICECPECGRNRTVEKVVSKETMIINGVLVPFDSIRWKCKTCGENFDSIETMDSSLRSAKYEYAKIIGEKQHHYRWKDKIYINLEHLDEKNKYVKRWREHVENAVDNYLDITMFETVVSLNNAFFKCPICGSNRFNTYNHDGNLMIECSNSSNYYKNRFGYEVDACPGFQIKYNDWLIRNQGNKGWVRHNKKENNNIKPE